MTDPAARALARLQDPDGDALRGLARLVVDQTTATPIAEIASPRWIASQLATALEAEAIPGEAARHANACGPGALAACCALVRARGVQSGSILEHTSSHEVATPDEPFRMAVGYAGIVF